MSRISQGSTAPGSGKPVLDPHQQGLQCLTGIPPAAAVFTERLQHALTDAMPMLETCTSLLTGAAADYHVTHWRMYGVEFEDVFCWSCCGNACAALGFLLRQQGFEVQERVNLALPPAAGPEYFSRGPFGFAHAVLVAAEPEGGSQIILDPTYRQFIFANLNLYQRSELPQSGEALCRRVLEALPQAVLVMPLSTSDEIAMHLAKAKVDLGDSRGVDYLHRLFKKIWNIENYHPIKPERQASADGLLEKLVQELRAGDLNPESLKAVQAELKRTDRYCIGV